MIHSDVSVVLRAVAALRALCLGLPHLPTPAEAEQLRRFDALAASPGSATERDRDALAAGWRRWWRTGQLDRLREMVKSLRPELVEGDRELSSYARAAELRQLGAPDRTLATTSTCARPAGRRPTG